MDQQRITELIEKVYQNKASAQEIEELDLLYAQYDSKIGYTESLGKSEKKELRESIYAQIEERLPKETKNPNKPVFKTKFILRVCMAIAASIFLIGLPIVYLTHLNPEKKAHRQLMADITPGGNKAFLILADGRKIDLDAAGNGKVAQQAGISISKTASGQLSYTFSGPINQSSDPSNDYNTIETPKGGQYLVKLPDGTQVWLNAASSLRFPLAFSGKERKVVLTGEGYFEVAKDKSKPFRVMSGNQMVEVLGTHFNINSYANEGNIKTTLVEGSVKVHSGAKTNTDLMLIPGQQAINNGHLMSLNTHPDIEEIISWKEGSFQFNDTSLSSIMRQLSRWYDVDVEFVGQVPDYHFHGRISRDTPIAQIFEILKTGGLNFTIEGRRIIVRD
ncbi:DUF4974 domain-containing protein [Pedobacter riviphilus]|uniref:DUF4974 domain-containing protein n=1 Tax=Pedobacter riviphilus TaxID=2766984 RepID=A0ABX6TIB5_9SPHI|nr:FecR family protein [Pedobacter riviphilus]QNR85259.1 DUF4974 domain-containing protein [Pedobacter riviphilus]